MEKQWTLEDLNQLAAFSEELKERGALSVGIGYRRTSVLVTHEALAQQAALLGQQPRKEPHGSGKFWLCTLECGDLALQGLFYPHELPLIGYPEEPLPPKEEVAAEAEAALQAS